MKNLSRKEAITILESMMVNIPVPKATVTQIKRNLALDMAINALNCSEIPNKSDTINRQAAIDEALTFIVEYCGAAFDEDMQKMLCERLDALPPAQPEIDNVVSVWNKRVSVPIEEAREINEKFEIIKQAFLKACRYLQRNPPEELEDYSIEEINALAGAGSYEDGYKQWANYFINIAIKNSEHNK